jgi:hypothetical protein
MVAYVRSKKIIKNGKEYTYYQVVRGYRENGKVKQEVVAHLGTNATPEEAIAEWESRAAWRRESARDHLRGAQLIREGKVPRRRPSWSRWSWLLPREGTEFDPEMAQNGHRFMFAPKGWFFHTCLNHEDGAETAEREAAELNAKAEEYEGRAARLRSVL